MVRSRILVKVPTIATQRFLLVSKNVTLTGTQQNAFRESQLSVNSSLIETLLNQRKPIAQIRCASPRTSIVLSEPQPFESTFLTSKRARWLTIRTMATSLRQSIFFSHQHSLSWASRSQISRPQETEQLSSSCLKPSATVTKSENSMLCITRPKKFANPRTTW